MMLTTPDSPLHISVLGLFVELKARFPNMVVGLITRDSIKYALEHGINTPQIINYLKAHAHFQMKKKVLTIFSVILFMNYVGC